jgi:uncharacterized protein DUF4389
MEKSLNVVHAGIGGHASVHPVDVTVTPAMENRNRLSTAFRPFLAIPHILLVGGPMALAMSFAWRPAGDSRVEWAGTGALGAVASVAAVIGWFAILFTGTMPEGLWKLGAFYLRWRVRAVAYLSLLRDEYPPFEDAPYPAALTIAPPDAPRNRVTVAFRIFLLLPHLIVLGFLGVAWCMTTIIAWLSILFTGEFPRALYEFGVGMLLWTTRVEAYLLLLHDEYPPFAFA